MKYIKRNYRGILAAVMALGFVALGTTQSKADYYHHDDRGYWDGHHHYHHYDYYNNRRGYWDNHSGVRVFIGI